MKIVFLHPDLGIGGAERLVVDAALALQLRGHSVRFLTSHHDVNHCFPETRESLEVTVVGDFLPRRIFNRFYALCAYIRMIFAALYLCLFSNWEYDLVFVDQISACIPLIRWFSRTNAKIVFYCHFPDQLLTDRTSFAKKCYRYVIDGVEEKSTGAAHCILVNSRFTENVFRETFKSLSTVAVRVLYPCVDESKFDAETPELSSDIVPVRRLNSFFLSLNRYERKKNIGLAIEALSALKSCMSTKDFDNVQLVIAGGYDPNLPENADYFEELLELTRRLELENRVTFLKSPSEPLKRSLLKRCLALLYTPDREHFGIVPVEAMYCNRPVIALRSGGPTETVLDGQTGLLVAPNDVPGFADRMRVLLKDSHLADDYGRRGRERAVEKFSFDVFGANLNEICQRLVTAR